MTRTREAVLQTFPPDAAGRRAAGDYARLRPEFSPAVTYVIDPITGESYWEVIGEARRMNKEGQR